MGPRTPLSPSELDISHTFDPSETLKALNILIFRFHLDVEAACARPDGHLVRLPLVRLGRRGGRGLAGLGPAAAAASGGGRLL